MACIFIAPLSGLEISPNFEFDYGVIITSSIATIKDKLTEEEWKLFGLQIGMLEFASLHRASAIAYLYVPQDFLHFPTSSIEVISAHNHYAKLSQITLAGFWLFIDNCIFFDKSYIIIKPQKNNEKNNNIFVANAVWTPRISNSSSEEFPPTCLTHCSYELWGERIMKYVDSCCKTYDSLGKNASPEVFIKDPALVLAYNKDNYNRPDRSRLFIDRARGETFRPLKITFYIGALESLFSTDVNEIKLQVSMRSAYYVGGTTKQIYDNFIFIKDAYTVRSKYVHGDAIGKSQTDLLDMAIKLDSFLRLVYNKLLSEGVDIFLGNTSSLDKYFERLLFPIFDNNK